MDPNSVLIAEEEPAAKPKKLKQAKASEPKKPETVETAAAKPSKQRKTRKSQPVAEEVEAEAATENTPSSENQEDEADDVDIQGLADELDSGDEGAAIDKAVAQFQPGQDVGAIPELAGPVRKAAAHEEPGVVYVGRIPHGFYEHEMRQYFAQFGTITRLRLSRNKKTGASKHFAFVEFAEKSTAGIVAKTMDNYLLFGHILKCKEVPAEKVHKDLWKGANRRFKKVPWNRMVGNQLSKPATQAGWEKRVTREQRRRSLKADKLKEIGYEFEAPALKAVPPPRRSRPRPRRRRWRSTGRRAPRPRRRTRQRRLSRRCPRLPPRRPWRSRRRRRQAPRRRRSRRGPPGRRKERRRLSSKAWSFSININETNTRRFPVHLKDLSTYSKPQRTLTRD